MKSKRKAESQRSSNGFKRDTSQSKNDEEEEEGSPTRGGGLQRADTVLETIVEVTFELKLERFIMKAGKLLFGDDYL